MENSFSIFLKSEILKSRFAQKKLYSKLLNFNKCLILNFPVLQIFPLTPRLYLLLITSAVPLDRFFFVLFSKAQQMHSMGLQ